MSEGRLLAIVAAVQFVNILDFMMVMPLGPDFARALQIPTSHIGYVGGAYTAAAALSGLVGAVFLDRFDRRTALAVSMFGLVVGTAAGAFATGLPTLLAARVVAGGFGGPATSVSLSIIADTVPAARRGRAMGLVMTAFSVASVLGVPAGLELAHRGTWRTPFIAVASLGLLVTFAAVAALPAMRGHLAREADAPTTFGELVGRRVVRVSWSATALVSVSVFILVPNIAAYVQLNLGYPRARLGLLYLCGGLASFFTLRAAGRFVDRRGPAAACWIATAVIVGTILGGFVAVPPWMPVTVIFILFMTGSSARNVAFSTLTSLVPRPHERARFMSVQSAVQHLASAAGAFLSARVLTEAADGKLVGMRVVALVAVALALLIPPIFGWIERESRA